MTVSEYIKKLEKLPQDAIVITTSSNPEMNGESVKAYPPSVMKMKKETRHFRDMMDGTSYSSEVYIYSNDGKDCVII